MSGVSFGPQILSNTPSNLNELQNTVKDGGFISLTRNYTYQDGDPTDGIIVKNSLYISGNNITIDGGNAARLFVIEDGASLYVSGINFVNAKTGSEGGAIYYKGGSGFINDCTFVNCSAASGGAVYYDGLSLVINNTLFKDNSASNYGAGIYIAANSTIISNSNFTNNTAGNNGGAVYWKKNSRQTDYSQYSDLQGSDGFPAGGYATAVGINVQVYSLYSFGWGENINITNSPATLCFGKNNNVDNSFASTVMGNNINIKNSIAASALNDLIVNDGKLAIVDSSFDLNSAKVQGGAVYMADDTALSVNYCNFNGNLAGDGGAIRSSDVNIFKSNFTLNHAGSKGGAMLVCGEANIYLSTFRKNTAYYRGGAVYSGLTKKVTRVYHSTFDSNGITGLRSGDYYGGALFDADLIDSCVFTNNYAWSGGAVYQWCDHDFRLRINNSTFDNNTAIGTGGAVYAHYGANIVYSNFTNNRAGDVGGGVGGWNHITQKCLFINNSAKYGGGAGGESMRAYSNVFINNSATHMGGTIWGFNLIITDNLIINTTAANMGGAIATNEYLQARSIFTNNVIINSNSSKGGAVYFYNNNNNVYSIFSSNKITNSSADIGGAIYSYSKTTLSDNTFENSNAEIGGVIYNDLDLTLVNNIMKDSTAKLGKHIYNAMNVGVSYLTFLNNRTKYVNYLDEEVIYANLTDDMGNTITGQNITFEIDDESFDVEVIDGIACFKYKVHFDSGEKQVNGTYQGSTLDNTMIKTAKLRISDIILNIKKAALIPVTELGNQTIFEITVYNNGTGDVFDLFIIEDSYEGLVFDHYLVDDLWTHSIVDGKHKWTLKEELAPEETVGLFVYFNTTKAGNFTNYAVVGAEGSESITVNATVTVNETVDDLEGMNPKLNLRITALHPLVSVGDEIKFEVIVSNDGDVVLHDVTISEHSFEGLTFLRIEDHTGLWNQTGSISVTDGLLGANEELSWKMNHPLYTNEVLGFFMVFKTTSHGVFTNSVVGSSDKTDEVIASDDVEVAMPQYTIEKIASKDSVTIGDKVSFEIIVRNTGKVNLTDLTIIERPDEGLVYDSSTGLGEYWTESSDFAWILNKNITPGSSSNFTVIFTADKIGNLTNVIVSDSQSANATVEVMNITNSEIVPDSNSTSNDTSDSNSTSNTTSDSNDIDSNSTSDTISDSISDDDASEEDDSDDGLFGGIMPADDGMESPVKSYSVSKNATGNPLIVLLIVLLSLVIYRKDRK